MYAASHHVIHLSRIGLVSVEGKIEQCLLEAWKQYVKRSVLRLEHKVRDDHFVHTVLDIVHKTGKPGELSFAIMRHVM